MNYLIKNNLFSIVLVFFLILSDVNVFLSKAFIIFSKISFSMNTEKGTELHKLNLPFIDYLLFPFYEYLQRVKPNRYSETIPN